MQCVRSRVLSFYVILYMYAFLVSSACTILYAHALHSIYSRNIAACVLSFYVILYMRFWFYVIFISKAESSLLFFKPGPDGVAPIGNRCPDKWNLKIGMRIMH